MFSNPAMKMDGHVAADKNIEILFSLIYSLLLVIHSFAFFFVFTDFVSMTAQYFTSWFLMYSFMEKKIVI